MTKLLKFHFDFVSPYSYLAYTQLDRLAATYDVEIELVPIHVLSLMAKVGNRPTTVECPAKARYAAQDLARWAANYRVVFAMNPSFRSIDTRALLDGAAIALQVGVGGAYVRTVFEGMWKVPSRFETDAEIVALLEQGGVENAADVWAARLGMREQIDRNVEQSAAQGLFGAPSFILDGVLFFGNDRLAFVEQALAS